MKINRTQDVHNVPDWVTAGTHLEAIEKNDALLRAGIDRLNVAASSEVDDMCLFDECEQIEKCASSGETYYYNSTWSDNHLGHLKEFASICGLGIDKMIGVDPTSFINREASSSQMVKTASVEQESSMEIALKEVLGDPFHLEERTNMDHMRKANWETITPEAKLADAPTLAMMGGILPLRGGEDYRIANQPGLAPNQNSIADPGALDRLWNSNEEGNGERLAREAQERLDQRQSNHEAWEQEKLAQMKYDEKIEFDITSKSQGMVFPTEVGNVGSGISSNFMGAYSVADLANLPEKTAGESLSDKNEARKASIQRGSKGEDEARDWDRIKKAPSVRVSDHFTDELKRLLG